MIGGGISGLLAARELARAGVHTTVLEAATAWGGCVGSHVVAGLTLDSGAESFATRSSAVADLAAELGLAGEIVAPNPGGAWVQLPDGAPRTAQDRGARHPGRPLGPEVRRSLGLLGSLRASVDACCRPRWAPLAGATSVSAAGPARMGKRVLDRLVAPGGRRRALGRSRQCSTSTWWPPVCGPASASTAPSPPPSRPSAGERRPPRADPPDRPEQARPAGSRRPVPPSPGCAAACTPSSPPCWPICVSADVTLLPGTAARSVRRTADGWRVATDQATFDAGLLAVAVEGPAAVGLLEESLPELAGHRPDAGPDVSLVTLVVDLPALDAAPRGTGVLVAPQSPGVQAKALTHATAKWAWLAEQAGPGRHVLRLSYGRSAAPGAVTPGALPESRGGGLAAAPRSDDELFRAALADASALLVVPVGAGDVADWDVVRWAGALPFASLGHRQRVAAVRSVCAADGTLAVVGGWLSGNGLAAIVADTPQQVRTLLP